MSWPNGIKSTGLRPQYAHIIDLSPTILAAAGIAPPSCVDGVPQQPINGIALNYSFDHPEAPDRRTTQYYELWGNRGVYSDGWKAVVLHKKVAWAINATVPFSQDEWELYDVRKDPGEVHDLSAKNPEEACAASACVRGAGRSSTTSIRLTTIFRARAASQDRDMHDSRTDFDYPQPGVHAMSEILSAPLAGHNYTLTTTFVATASDEGVLIAAGGVEAGYSLYLKNAHVHYDYNEFGLEHYSLVDAVALPEGRSTAQLQWTQTGPANGVMVLLVNGREAAKASMSMHVYGAHGSNELFNRGTDLGAPASSAYRAPFRFTGSSRMLMRPSRPAAN